MGITLQDLSVNIELTQSNASSITSIKSDISNFIPSSTDKYNIFVIGDSTLTYNARSPSATYAHVLSAQIKQHDEDNNLFSVYRIGNTADLIHNACFNTGAYQIYLKPFVLPGDGSETSVDVETLNGWKLANGVGSDSLQGPDICNNVINGRSCDKPDLNTSVAFGYNLNITYGYGVNPIELSGIRCHLRRLGETGELSTSYSASTLYIKRLPPYGDDIEFTYPPAVHTAFDILHKNNDVVVFFIGTNNDVSMPTGSTNASDYLTTLMTGLHAMVDNLKTKKYIVVGPYTKNTSIAAGTWTNFLFRMGIEFGKHFLNLLLFAVEYGLLTEGITPTESDLSAIEAGQMPKSFMADVVHMNKNGYSFLGKQIYWKGVELGYWK